MGDKEGKYHSGGRANDKHGVGCRCRGHESLVYPSAQSHYPVSLASAGIDVPISDIGKEMGRYQHSKEHPEDDPLVMPTSTTVPEGSSRARASADEHVCTDDVPANRVVGNQAMTIEVVREENISFRLTHTGNPLDFKHFSSLLIFS